MTAATQAAPAAALEATHLTRAFGRRVVLEGVSVTLRSGEIVALLGPNGAGKTTLIDILAGVASADSGAVDAGGSRPGWVPQRTGSHPRLTVAENLRFFAALNGLDTSRAALEAAAARTGLVDRMDSRARNLSGGLRQRLNVAIGLLGDPTVVLLDEPTTGVDLAHRHALWQVLRERADAGAAILFSTHDVDDARIADRVIVLRDGRVAHDGTLAALARASSTPDDIVAALLSLWEGE